MIFVQRTNIIALNLTVSGYK